MLQRVMGILATAAVLACGGGEPSGPGSTITLDPAELRVVFVGNSLTYSHDIPGIVQGLADAAGYSFAHATLARPNFSLEDHWVAGVPDVLLALEADVVVMQQGPSSLPESREHLVGWAGQFAGVIREAGGEPALYMVWPSYSWAYAFPDVYGSYRAAADAVNGAFVPAGQTWVEAWELDPALGLYDVDGFHPSYLGALAAAQTLFAVLFDVSPDSVPVLDDGVSPETLALLRTALAASLARADSGATALPER